MTHDLVLRGGTVLDGTGAPGFIADVAVTGGRVTQVGPAVGPAARVLDASGAMVCPGFIDLHSHADFTVFSAPEAVTQATQGVTTLVTGNCGFSPFPVTAEHADELRAFSGFIDDGLPWQWSTAGEYADAVDRLPLGVNLALQVGHGSLRIAAMGPEDRPPNGTELANMRALVRQSARDGVVGLSTGLIYAPGMFAQTDELIAVVTEAAQAGLLYSTHIRDESTQLGGAVAEAISIARQAGARLEISHLKASGPPSWGTVTTALEMIDQAQRDGTDVRADQYPYTAGSTTLTSFLPAWTMNTGLHGLLQRLDSAQHAARIAAELTDAQGHTFWPERIVIADTRTGPYTPFIGQSVAAVATHLGVTAGQAVVELLRGQQGAVGVIHHAMSEDDVRHVMRHPSVAVASDGQVLGCPGPGKPHPRSMGTFVRVLGHYCRDEAVLEIPEAVRKMTALPASRLGWRDRGLLCPGAIADIAVFDPVQIRDNATFEQPWQTATGVRHTLVSGTPVLENGHPTGAAAGRVIRHPAR